MRNKAIFALYPNVIRIGDKAGAFDKDNNQINIDEKLVNEKIAELEELEPMRLLRLERNRRLLETDWIIVKGLEQGVDLTEWKTYRQALRDLPVTQEPKLDYFSNLINVDWPEVPA